MTCVGNARPGSAFLAAELTLFICRPPGACDTLEMDDSEDSAGRNRRETPASVTIGRAARALVTPVQEKLGAWQAEAVKLDVMVQRIGASGRHDPRLAEAVRALLGVVRMQVQLFDTALADAIPAVRAHGRVADTGRVLALLVARLEKISTDLGEPPNKAR
jgi:hypothetical protein